MKEKKYDAVIFDKDGVIADSEYCNVMAKHNPAEKSRN